MKKTILALVFCTLFIPSFVSAQTASSTPASPELAALILQLQAKIQELQQQLAALQASSTPSGDDSTDAIALNTLTQTLSRGMSNEQVADLQRYLAMHPDIYPEGLITGYFGALTEQAVKRLQASKGLEPVGIVGPKTRAIINTEIAPFSGGSSGGGGGTSSSVSIPVQTSSSASAVTLQSSGATNVVESQSVATSSSSVTTASSVSTTTTTTSSVSTTTNSSTSTTSSANTTTNSSTPTTTSSTPTTPVVVSTTPTNDNSSNGTTTADTTTPTVSVSAPAANATIFGAVTVTASASDNVGVSGVQFILDGANLGSEDTSSPFSVSWDTTSVANGTHVLSARARDAAGNQTTSSPVSVTVNNVSTDTTPPSVSITVPPVSGYLYVGDKTVSVTASASDNIAVAGVRFYVDGVLIGDEDTSSPYSAPLSTSSYSSGSHTLAASAHDAAGNAATSSVIFYTSKTRPVVTSTALPTTILSTGTQVIGKITIAADSQGSSAVAWRRIVLNYSASANVSLSNFQMFDSNAYYSAGFVVPNAQPLANVTVSSTGSTITFTSSADQEIAGSKTYVITATVGGSLQSGDTVTTYVPAGVSQFSAPTTLSGVSSAASLVWSDESAVPHSDTSSDWNNEFLLTTGSNVYIPTSAQTMTY